MLFGSAFINLISSWQSSLVVSIKNAEDISFLVIFNCGLAEVTNILLGAMYIDNLNYILSRILPFYFINFLGLFIFISNQ